MIAAVHGLVIWFYQIPFPNPANMRQSMPASPVIMAAGTDLDAASQEHPLMRDPLLLSRAHAKGYTGELWNKSFKSPNPYTDWNESPRYLSDPFQNWGSAFSDYLDQSSKTLWKQLTKPRAKLDQVSAEPLEINRVSSWRFSPNLQPRVPNNLPDLPYWKGSSPLSPTRMQIGVDTTGMIQSIRLLEPQQSDSIQRDFLQKAIQASKRLKFKPVIDRHPVPSMNIEWGEIEIQWQQEVPTNNQTSKVKGEDQIR